MKPNKNSLADSPLSDEGLKSQTAEPVKAKAKKVNKNNKNANKKDPNKKENFFIRVPKRIGRAFVNMWKELKNVTWPTFAKALSSTGVVLAVVAIFFLLLLAIDSGLGAIFNLIVK